MKVLSAGKTKQQNGKPFPYNCKHRTESYVNGTTHRCYQIELISAFAAYNSAWNEFCAHNLWLICCFCFNGILVFIIWKLPLFKCVMPYIIIIITRYIVVGVELSSSVLKLLPRQQRTRHNTIRMFGWVDLCTERVRERAEHKRTHVSQMKLGDGADSLRVLSSLLRLPSNLYPFKSMPNIHNITQISLNWKGFVLLELSSYIASALIFAYFVIIVKNILIIGINSSLHIDYSHRRISRC